MCLPLLVYMYRAGGSGQAGLVSAGPLFHSSKKKEFFVGFRQPYVPDQAFQSTHISFPPRNGATQCMTHGVNLVPRPKNRPGNK